MSRGIERVWARDGAGARALAPLSWLFGVAVACRNAAYDRGWLAQRALGLPAVSVGNLTVGGTGKTPVSAWVARWFATRGARPGLLLRGHGGDETLVHGMLAPGTVVVADPDRVAGAARAAAAGARVLVLDDAFQHRRARRDVDLVLVAAEQGGARRLLPAGPLREGRAALARAHALVVTRKSAGREAAEGVAADWAQGRLPTVVMHLEPTALVRGTDGGTMVADTERPLDGLRGLRVLAVSAIGNPAAFEAQLASAGADVEPLRFPDHHPFGAGDAEALARRAREADLVVCTLKDAVKLRSQWPAQAPPFWYLSQAVRVERGAGVLDGLLEPLLAADTPR